MSLQPFTPSNTSAKISVTGVSAATSIPGAGNQLYVYNKGTGDVFYRVGTSTVTAAVDTSTIIPVGSIQIFGISDADTHIATISSGTATLYITRGNGQ